MKYLSLPALLILLCLNVCAGEGIVKSHQESSDTLQLMKKYQVLDEIERLKSEIDQLTSAGHISSSVALSVSAVLATIAYGLTFTGLGLLITGEEFDIDYLMDGLLITIFPGLGLGALLGVSNSELYIQPEEAFWLPFKTAIAYTGFWLMGYGITSLPSHLFYGKSLNLEYKSTVMSAFFTMPMYAYHLYCRIIHRLEGRKQKVLNLEFRLDEARNHLSKFEDLSFKNQDPGISPQPLYKRYAH